MNTKGNFVKFVFTKGNVSGVNELEIVDSLIRYYLVFIISI